MRYEYKIIKVDVGDEAVQRQAVSTMVSEGGRKGWRVIHVEHEVLGQKIVWMERRADDKESVPEVQADSPDTGDAGSGEEDIGGQGNSGN